MNTFLRNVIENYLISIKETQFHVPFAILLENLGFYDVHIIHGTYEFGIDIIAKKKLKKPYQYAFQVKIGDVGKGDFLTLQSQIEIGYSCKQITHPNFDGSMDFRFIVVVTGKLIGAANVIMNQYKKSKKNLRFWFQSNLLTSINDKGFESFFSFHNNPKYIVKFYDLYLKILNNQPIDFMYIENYSKDWLSLDFEVNLNKNQVVFETYIFSKLLFEKNRFYEAVLILCGLTRALIKFNLFEIFRHNIEEYMLEICDQCLCFISKLEDTNSLLDECTGTFSFLYYPKYCQNILEIIALSIIIDSGNEKRNSFMKDFLNKEKGSYRPLSDNNAMTVVFVSMALIKLKELDLLRKYLTNITVWICDRYSDLGIGSLGRSVQQEFEQLISERFEAFEFHKTKSSFIAYILLTVSEVIKDQELYENIANDLKACGIILTKYHVLNDDQVFTYNGVCTQYDADYSVLLQRNLDKRLKIQCNDCTNIL